MDKGLLVRQQFLAVLLAILVGLSLTPETLQAAFGIYGEEDQKDDKTGPVRTDVSQINAYNRVHRRSNIWINISNYGFFGNNSQGRSDANDDPCRPGEWAPQAEYPGGSGNQYLFMGAGHH